MFQEAFATWALKQVSQGEFRTEYNRLKKLYIEVGAACPYFHKKEKKK